MVVVLPSTTVSVMVQSSSGTVTVDVETGVDETSDSEAGTVVVVSVVDETTDSVAGTVVVVVDL
jgi:hypothetical protein